MTPAPRATYGHTVPNRDASQVTTRARGRPSTPPSRANGSSPEALGVAAPPPPSFSSVTAAPTRACAADRQPAGHAGCTVTSSRGAIPGATAGL